jgi:hypothetical protein
VVDKGKGRMTVAARAQNGDVELLGGLVVAPKGKGRMAAPRRLVGIDQAGAGSTAAAQGQDDVDLGEWLNMEEFAEGELGGA